MSSGIQNLLDQVTPICVDLVVHHLENGFAPIRHQDISKTAGNKTLYTKTNSNFSLFIIFQVNQNTMKIIVRRAGLLWSQQDFEWWWSVPLSSASLY